MYTLRQKVVWFALISRIVVLALQTLFNAVLPDHEAEGVFRRPQSRISEISIVDQFVHVLFKGLERWDAQYFLHIADNGYVYENSLAFFPFFPMVVRFLSGCLNIVTFHLLSTQSLLILASILLNTICFVKAADILFDHSAIVLKDNGLAYKAVLLFCINPASIFFSAPYSEAVFAFLSFYGMRHAFHTERLRYSALPFGLAAATRSNGILNIGFIVYSNLKNVMAKWPVLAAEKGIMRRLLLPFKVIMTFLPMVESCIIALAPFLAYQAYCYFLFCTPQVSNIPDHLLRFGQTHGLIMPGKDGHFKRAASHWCNLKLPIAYAYVQDHYWNVGFFRYYEWKQIPNFLLAAPIIFLIFSQTYIFFKEHRSLCFNLGLKPKCFEESQKISQNVMSPDMFIFVAHAFFLTLFCTMFVHIQVTTRMICSASPVPYWFAAYLVNFKSKVNHHVQASDGVALIAHRMKKLNSNKITTCDNKLKISSLELESLENMQSKWRVIILTKLPDGGIGQAVLFYFYLYAIVGTVLFCNFLPWT